MIEKTYPLEQIAERIAISKVDMRRAKSLLKSKKGNFVTQVRDQQPLAGDSLR